MKAAQKKEQPDVASVPFPNPDPIAHLVGCSNEAPVIVDGQEMTALIDLGAQISSICSQFCRNLELQIQPLGQLLELEGTGVVPSYTSGLWRSTSRSWGSKTTMRMCCCWSYQPRPILRWSQSWLDPKS